MDAHSLAKLEFDQVRELLAGYARCSLGRQIALRIGPVRRRDQVRRWLDQLRQMLVVIEQKGIPPFAGVHDIRELVAKAVPPSALRPEDFARIGETLVATGAISDYLAELPDHCDHLKRLAERIGSLEPLAERIWRALDRRGQVRDDATERLATIRRKIADAQAAIGQVFARLLRSPAVVRLLQYPSATFHNDRTVLPLKAEHRGRLPGIIHRSSDSGATLFIEPAEAVELNNTIVRLRQDEHDEISRILWHLAQDVHQNADQIQRSIEALAALDLLTAKALLAREFEMIVPEVNDAGLLRLHQARHPLLMALQRQDLQAGRPPRPVVPIDIRLGDDFDMLVITGPNTGGKTVALKTVGLLAAMVQAGLAIPVGPGSTLPVFDDVLIDVGDEQSLQQSLSTFSAHMSHILRILRRARKTTLVLLDELGAGTDPDEGAAIGQAILDELLRRGCPSLVTTHLGTLKGLAYRRRRVDNAAVEFDPATLQPTYCLRIGEPGNSNAMAIARRLGMPRRLIDLASRNLSGRHRALSRAIAGTLASRRRAEAARAEAEAATRAAAEARARAQQQAQSLQKQQAEFQQWARSVSQLKRGDPVYVRSFQRDGKIVRISLQSQRAEVDLGTMTVELPFVELQPHQAPAGPVKPQRPAVSPVTEQASTSQPASSPPAPRRSNRPRRI
ncbi:MAG: MutS2/Smr-associated SH3 domain-containing protein, partial [Phycisphaerae bacterium]